MCTYSGHEWVNCSPDDDDLCDDQVEDCHGDGVKLDYVVPMPDVYDSHAGPSLGDQEDSTGARANKMSISVYKMTDFAVDWPPMLYRP